MDLKKFLRTTDRFVNILKEEGIKTPKDFYYYFPKSYEDRTKIKKISELQEWVKSVIRAKVVDYTIINTPKWKRLIEFTLEDEDKNIIYANFFGNNYILKQLKKWQTALLVGKPKFSYWKYVLWYPEILPANEKDSNLVWRIVPVYSDLLGIKWSWFQKKMFEKIDEVNNYVEEFLPDYLLQKYNLLDIFTALKNIHFPKNMDLLTKSKFRFNFEKLFIWQLVSNLNIVWKTIWEKTEPNRDIIKEFLKILPFELTKAQKKAIKVIIDDIHSGKIMTRLLQWDVWSWKTIVSTIVAYYVIRYFWKQVAFLVPTEVLAKQHLLNISKFFLPLGIKIALLTGSTKPKEKEQIKQQLSTWDIDFVVWTHAIIQDDVKFKDLWLVIIDEQHKFWVNQRAKLNAQWNPHILQMTATPIPRSLALAYFWEFENTIIDELPPWRKPVYTKVISEKEFEQLKWFLLNKIQQGQQVYIVVPLIEESEKLEGVKSALQEYEDIKRMFNVEETGFPKIWLMHWKLRSDEKEKIMKDFKEKKIDILVSTTVIEVWVDVPTATIMIIKNAERFGLAALHQLRWRVGRSDLKSYCFLVTKTKAWDSYRRLKYMEKYNDWFKLAEIDLKLRWPWTILWTQQSWQIDLPEEALKDVQLLEITRKEAQEFLMKNWLEKYPNLKKEISKYKQLDILKA